MIDIVLVNYCSAADTLQALARLAPWPHGTVWLVDNSAHERDMTADTAVLRQACADWPWVTLLTPGDNIGFGRACNLAFEKSTAEFFLLLNPDARISIDNILLLARTLAEQPRLGAVSPKIFWNEARSFVLPAAFAPTPLQRMALTMGTHFPQTMRLAAQSGVTRTMRKMASERVFRVRFLAGAVMLVRRTAAVSAGGLFDPDYFMFFEDTDLSSRLRRAGHGLAMVPAASAVHEYRHKAYKAGLMAQSEHQYFEKRHPLFYRMSNRLTRVAVLARPMVVADWFMVLPQPVRSAEEFARLTGGAHVLALSPSLLMMPAMTRPSTAELRCFDEQEWGLLEPAAYVALLKHTHQKPTQKWTYFERA